MYSDQFYNTGFDFEQLDRFLHNTMAIMIPIMIILLCMLYLKNPSHRRFLRRKWREHKILRKTWIKHRAVGIIFGKDQLGRWVYSPIASEPPHICVFAPTGGGKTWSILLQTLNALSDRIGGYIPDISGDIYSNLFSDDVLVYAPEDSCTIKYNVFGDIDLTPHRREKSRMLEELALIFFPDKEFKNGSEKFFYEGGRDILIAALTAFYFEGLDFPEICKKIKGSDYNSLFSELTSTENKKAIDLLAQFVGQKESDIAGCMGNAVAAISLFANTDYLEENNFGRPNHNEDYIKASDVNHHFVVLNIPRRLRDVYAPLNKLITKQIMQVVDKRPIGMKPYCLLALDELSTLVQGTGSVTNQLISSMQNIRKLNGRIMYLTQSIKDIDVYAGEGKRSIIIDNTGFIVAMGAFDPDTRQFFADLIGKELVTNEDGFVTAEYRVPPDDFADIPDKNLYLIWRGGYIKLRKTFFFNDPEYKDGHASSRIQSNITPTNCSTVRYSDLLEDKQN